MEYKGQLHGKVDKIYFPLMNTSEQFDKMYEVLKQQIKLEKKDVKYGHSSITKLRHHKRLQQLESLLNEIENESN